MGLTICEDYATCLTHAVIKDSIYYLPDLIGDRFGMPTSQYQVLAIALPVITSTAVYTLLWAKSWGESRLYGLKVTPICSQIEREEGATDICTKWSFTKIFAAAGVTVIPLQLMISIVSSRYSPPQSDIDRFTQTIFYEQKWEFFNSSACACLIKNSMQVSGSFASLEDLQNTIDKGLQEIPKWLGGVSLLVTMMIGLKLLISCFEKRAFKRQDAFAAIVVGSTLIFSIYQLIQANKITIEPYLKTDIETCNAIYLR